MSGVNKVLLIGNLGRNPELRYTQNGTPICRLNLATTRAWTSKSTNQKVEETEWHRITVWGKQAEHCNTFLEKGRSVYVEGRIKTSDYTDKDGIKRYSTEVVAEVVQFLGGRTSSAGEESRGVGAQGSTDQASGSIGGSTPPSSPADAFPGGAPQDDDIPF